MPFLSVHHLIGPGRWYRQISSSSLFPDSIGIIPIAMILDYQAWPVLIHIGKWRQTSAASWLKRSLSGHTRSLQTEWRWNTWISHVQRGGKSYGTSKMKGLLRTQNVCTPSTSERSRLNHITHSANCLSVCGWSNQKCPAKSFHFTCYSYWNPQFVADWRYLELSIVHCPLWLDFDFDFDLRGWILYIFYNLGTESS
jgi:hypothetical protein